MKVTLICLCILICKTLSTVILSNSISTCITYESSSSYKWCRYLTTNTLGYGCDASDTSSYCGGSSYYRCSSDSSYLPQNSKKLLCPSDFTNCNF